MRRKALWIGGIAAVHALLTTAAVLTAMGLAMGAFDGARAPGLADRASSAAVRILMAPLVPLYTALAPRSVQGLPFVGNAVVLLNSLTWATALVWLAGRSNRRRAV